MKLETLKKFIDNNYNVLFIGRHGVGKTTVVQEAFEAAGLKWKYFSASTMDPWVDFVGVPRERMDEKGEPFLDLVRPRDFRDDEVEAIFFDEYNRSHKKVRNAVMELIQFKSINGRKFDKLRFVWAAVNPPDDADHHYDVEEVDPAQEDRFQIHIQMPYKPSKKFFRTKYGEDIAEAAIEWWNELGKEAQNEVSPRRLDYALEANSKNIDLAFVLPKKSNYAALKKRLATGSITSVLEKLYKARDSAKATTFLAIENNFSAGLPLIVKDEKRAAFFLPTLSSEKLSLLLTSRESSAALVQNVMIGNYHSVSRFQRVIDEIVAAGRNLSLTRKLGHIAHSKGVTIEGLEATPEPSPWPNVVPTGNSSAPTFVSKIDNHTYSTNISNAKRALLSRNSYGRKTAYSILERGIPQNMSPFEGLQTIAILLEVVEHSQQSTIIKKLPNAAGMMNAAYEALLAGDPNVNLKNELRTLGVHYRWVSIQHKIGQKLKFTLK